ncbi:MAG: phosphatidylserine decarboxylase [Clostridiales bacterium]|nr:MAG: phosphatidylserine decarboxylase [Clostridiales bacterium]
MLCKDRKGNVIESKTNDETIIRKLYETNLGRGALKVLTKKTVSDLGGVLLNTKFSKVFIDKFIRENNIDMSDYVGYPYNSYNEFFIRKIRKGARTVDKDKNSFISPADSKLTVYKIGENSEFNIKNVNYTFEKLFRSKKLAETFNGGYIMIFRLSVDDYHRYIYVDDGVKSNNYTINGVYHTVNPIASDIMPIYAENQREFSLLKSKNFDTVLMMEVGAMMVGKIVNYHKKSIVKRGQEKGRFEFGGSTVILCVKENVIKIDDDILINSKNGIETKVKLGEKIASKVL